MREIALLGVLVGIKESVSHFNVSEEKVQKYITQMVGDPFFKNIRELILMSITYSDVPTAAKDFWVDEGTLERLLDFKPPTTTENNYTVEDLSDGEDPTQGSQRANFSRLSERDMDVNQEVKEEVNLYNRKKAAMEILDN